MTRKEKRGHRRAAPSSAAMASAAPPSEGSIFLPVPQVSAEQLEEAARLLVQPPHRGADPYEPSEDYEADSVVVETVLSVLSELAQVARLMDIGDDGERSAAERTLDRVRALLGSREELRRASFVRLVREQAEVLHASPDAQTERVITSFLEQARAQHEAFAGLDGATVREQLRRLNPDRPQGGRYALTDARVAHDIAASVGAFGNVSADSFRGAVHEAGTVVAHEKQRREDRQSKALSEDDEIPW